MPYKHDGVNYTANQFNFFFFFFCYRFFPNFTTSTKKLLSSSWQIFRWISWKKFRHVGDIWAKNKMKWKSVFSIYFFWDLCSLIAGAMDPVYTETKSILTDGDWKKLWMEAGNSNANLKKDNTIDSSDSPIFDDTEVSQASINYINNLAKLHTKCCQMW